MKAKTKECVQCGRVSPMKTWLGNHSGPQLGFIILLCFWIWPGVIFGLWAYGKSKCAICGKVAKHIDAEATP